MPTMYQTCPDAIQKISFSLMCNGHRELVEADVTITYLWARNNNGPAIMYHGWPAMALVRINNLRDRVAGLADATIVIDGDGWKEWDDKHRLAILDHELQHLQVKRDKVGAICYDDANRPKLRLRHHDFEIGGFHSIVAIHGADAQEAKAIIDVNRKWVQMQFDFEGLNRL